LCGTSLFALLDVALSCVLLHVR